MCLVGVEGCTPGHWGGLEGGERWQGPLGLRGRPQGQDLFWGMRRGSGIPSLVLPAPCLGGWVHSLRFWFSSAKLGSSWASRLLFWARTPLRACKSLGRLVCLWAELCLSVVGVPPSAGHHRCYLFILLYLRQSHSLVLVQSRADDGQMRRKVCFLSADWAGNVKTGKRLSSSRFPPCPKWGWPGGRGASCPRGSGAAG